MTVHVCHVSFLIPKDVKRTDTQRVDSCVAEFTNEKIRLYLDYGHYTSAKEKSSKVVCNRRARSTDVRPLTLKGNVKVKSIKHLLCSLCLVIAVSGIVSGKEWHGIVPLHSTVEDVERLLGQSAYGRGYAYETEDERIFFQYQYEDSECGKIWGRWNVPLGTVLSITVYPKKKILFSDLKIDLGKYVKSKTCMPGSYHYVDAEGGLSIAVDDDVVSGFTYLPITQDKYLACPNAGNPKDAGH